MGAAKWTKGVSKVTGGVRGVANPSIIEHVAAHFLFDTTLDRTTELCGFCLRPLSTSGCVFYLRKGKGSSAGYQVDLHRSRCPNAVKFAYLSASTSNPNAPCTNVPITCPLCSSTSSAVWRYNMEIHFKLEHSSAPWDNYKQLYNISESERAGMEAIWRKRTITKKRGPTKRSANAPLTLSDTHSSRHVIRNVDDFEDDFIEGDPGDSGSVDEVVDNDTRGSDDGYMPDPMMASSSPLVDQQQRPQDEPSKIDEAVKSAQVSESAVQAPPPAVLIASNQTDFNLEARPTRIGRVRKTRDMAEVSACLCGAIVAEDERTSDQAVQCAERGCETQWFHLDCLNFTFAPKNWRCDVHRPSKRPRRAQMSVRSGLL
ncbi:hypothetical protein BV22DRAFT_1027895 [Leucogyrophana mollusca]|uniref:Uncharacterized protein n=1 Tax=Leucogyrophana mollusca TaxID=85980 RepID=A0ACB8BYT0_9AGAM|nr:hypothetical protein BV22DRAFT_1027895 [Leucogyrophana mollusca]